MSIRMVVRYIKAADVGVDGLKLTVVDPNSKLFVPSTIFLVMMDIAKVTRPHTRLLRQIKMDRHTLTLINFIVKLAVGVTTAQDCRKLTDPHIKLLAITAKQRLKPNQSTATQSLTDA